MLPDGKLISCNLPEGSVARVANLQRRWCHSVMNGSIVAFADTRDLSTLKIYTGTFFNTNYKNGWSLTVDNDIRYFSASQNTSGSTNLTPWVISCGNALLKYDNTAHTFISPTTSFSMPKSRISGSTININQEWIDQTSSSIAYNYVILA